MIKSDYIFEKPLIEGVVLKRKSQYTMDVLLGNEVVNCHCPTTTRIGDIEVSNIPCLLSESPIATRKTKYTVEAISLDPLAKKQKYWIGINQNAANRYVEYFLSTGQLPLLVNDNKTVKREVKLGISKLDFLVDNTYIEVKTPLLNLEVEIQNHIKTKSVSEFNSHDRFLKHINELAQSLENNQRAILLSCFMYDNPGFKPKGTTKRSPEIRNQVIKCVEKGVELWQINLSFTPMGVSLNKYFSITNNFIE